MPPPWRFLSYFALLALPVLSQWAALHCATPRLSANPGAAFPDHPGSPHGLPFLLPALHP